MFDTTEDKNISEDKNKLKQLAQHGKSRKDTLSIMMMIMKTNLKQATKDKYLWI